MNDYENRPGGFPVSEENKAKKLNDELFTQYAVFEDEKKPSKERSSMKGVFKTLGILLVAVVCAFSGAFAGMYWICNTAIMGDSEFFEAVMTKNSGIKVNRVEVDYISGEYEPTDSVTLAEKILKYTVEIRIRSYDEELYEYTDSANGSGVIIGYDGEYATIVTNHHVVYGSKEFNVVLYDGSTYKGELLHLDEIGDLAIVRIQPDEAVEVATIADSDKLIIGQPLAAAGNPLGLGLSVSFGYLTHPRRDIGDDGGNFIQMDVTVNPGNSGGGLYDAQGNLVGIVTAKASGTNVDGIGYAIPSNRMLESVNDLLKFGYVKGRPAMGVTIVNVNVNTWEYFENGDLAGYLDGQRSYGVYVITSKYYDSIQKGDRIVSIDNKLLDTKEQLSSLILDYKAGDIIDVVLERGIPKDDGTMEIERVTVEIELRERDWVDENQ